MENINSLKDLHKAIKDYFGFQFDTILEKDSKIFGKYEVIKFNPVVEDEVYDRVVAMHKVFHGFDFDAGTFFNDEIEISGPKLEGLMIAEKYNPEIIKKEIDGSWISYKVRDRVSGYTHWIDVHKEGDDLEWQFNQNIFSTQSSKDTIEMTLQYNENVIQSIDALLA